MSLDIPETAEQVIQRAKTDVRRSWIGSNPFLKNSGIAALIIGYANRVFDFYQQLREAIKQSFPDSAEDEFLERWGSIFGVNRLAATTSSGNATATGVSASAIPIGTVYTTTDGVLYLSTATVNIADNSLSVSSLSRTGSTVTAVTALEHGLSSSVSVAISGAVETDYNGDQEIIVVSLTSFSYEITTTPTTPATGTILADFTSISVPLESEEFQDSENGIEVNQDLDSPLSLQSPLAGVDTVANVDFGAIGGGSDQESDSDLRLRLLGVIQDPIAHFSSADITRQAKLVNGVTRVFVFEVTPAVGQVTVYFMRDNDTDPIPTGSEVVDVKDSLLLIKPANTLDDDVIVAAPTALATNYTFSALFPNTAAMQSAIDANLAQFYAEETSVGVDITEEKYLTAIQSTIDESGAGLETFALSAPTGDITIATDEIGTLGTVTYP